MTAFTAILMIFLILSTLSAFVLENMANILFSDLINSFLSPLFTNVLSNSACRLSVKCSMKVRGTSVESPSPPFLSSFSLNSCLVSLNNEIGSIFRVSSLLISSYSISKRLIFDLFGTAFCFFPLFSVSFLLLSSVEKTTYTSQKHG